MRLEEPLYPVNLVLTGRPCLVVGGGQVARHKADGLLACGARVRVVAPVVCDELLAAATDPAVAVEVEQRPYRSTDVAGQRLVITATDSRDVNATVRADGEAAGIWVNAADDPPSCDFTLPAVLRRAPLLVTVSTGGSSPALAAWLRDRIAADFGSDVDTLLQLVAEARADVLAQGRSSEGLDWRSALDSGMLDLIRIGRISEARERLQACLS